MGEKVLIHHKRHEQADQESINFRKYIIWQISIREKL
jgi:hypothetical protein